MKSTMTNLMAATLIVASSIFVQVSTESLAPAGETKQPPRTTQNPAGGQMSGTEQVGNNSGRNADTKPKSPQTTKPQGK